MPLRLTMNAARHVNDVTRTDAPAIELAGDGITLINSERGRLLGNQAGVAAVMVSGIGSRIENAAGAVIQSSGANTVGLAVLGGPGDDVLINDGVIVGVVDLGMGDDRVAQVATGSTTTRFLLGAGQDSLSLDATTEISSFFAVADGGDGTDTLTISGGVGILNGAGVRNFENLVISATVLGSRIFTNNIDNLSGFSHVTIGAGSFVNFLNSVNPSADVIVTGGFTSIGNGSIFRSVTGSDADDGVDLGNGRILGAVSLAGGDDRFFVFGNAQFQSPASVNGGEGTDFLGLVPSGVLDIDLSVYIGFEILGDGGNTRNTALTLRHANGFSAIDFRDRTLLSIVDSHSPQARLLAIGSNVDISAGSTVGLYGFGDGPFTISLADLIAERNADLRFNTTIANRGSILGDVVLFFGDDVYDGSDGITGGTIFGLAGNDILRGGAAGEQIRGGFGADQLFGNGGDDILFGDQGGDTLNGGRGNDRLTGGDGSDVFLYDLRQFGQDTITDFRQGQDRIDFSVLGVGDFSQIQPFFSRFGADTEIRFFASGDAETITVQGLLPDQLTASDFIFQTSTTGRPVNGSFSNDLLFGGLGNDTLNGGDGNDTLIAGAGNDMLNGGLGNDELIGGPGIDTAIFTATLAQSTITRNGDGTIIISSQADGTDILSGVEFAQFNGIPVPLSRFADPGGTVVSNFAVNAGGWSSQDRFPRHVADVNGDGFADIVGFGQTGTFVSFGQPGGSFSAVSFASANFGANQGWTSDNAFRRELIDVNRDGRADIVGFGVGGVLVSLAQANGTFAAPVLGSTNFNQANGWSNQDAFARTLGDVNGDGFADVVGFGVAGTFVALGNGTGSFGAANFALANFGANQGWTSNNSFHRTVADVNGDGRTDVIGFGVPGTFVALGQANGTFAAPTLAQANFGTNQGWSSQDAFARVAGDVNGDGRADVVGFGTAGTFVSLGQIDGSFSAAAFDFANFGANQGWTSNNLFPRDLADLNNDGRADIVGFGFNGVFASTAFAG